MVGKAHWTFEDYLEQIFALSAINEVPGIEQQRLALIEEVWQFYPQECVELGLTDHAAEYA
jgi:hypothetical protein